MAKTYSIDYNSASVRNAEDMTNNIERLLKSEKIVDLSHFQTKENDIYSCLIKTRDDIVKYNIIVNKNDEENKTKYYILYLKRKLKLRRLQLVKTRVAACILAAGIGVTAYNLPSIINSTKNIGNKAFDGLKNAYNVSQDVDTISRDEHMATIAEAKARMNNIDTMINDFDETKGKGLN